MFKKSLLIMLLMAIFAPWAAMAQKPVPYNEGFENFSSEADLTADGWISAGASDCYIGITTTYYTEGSKALLISAWDGSNQSDSEVAALPVLNTPINQLQITLSYRQRSGGTVKVGYLTDANDASTFVALSSLPQSTSDFTTTTVELNEAPSTAARIAIQQYTWYDCYIDDIKVKVIPTCIKPTNLACTATTGTPATATFTWTNGGTETDWVLEYGTASDFTGATSIAINENDLENGAYTLTTGLTTETKHYARIKADCGDEESDWSNTVDFTPTNVQIKPITGTAGNSYYLPTNPNYDFSYTQQIYTGAEIELVGTIKSIAFKGNKAGTRTLVIYMANTTKETFSSKTDVIPIAEATQVFSGSVTFTANAWTTIELDREGFDYDGDNLAIIVDDNSDNYSMGSTNWETFAATDQALYYYQDDTNIDPASPSASYNALVASKNQLQLGILTSTTPKPKNLSIVENSLSSSGVTLQWQAPTTATPTGYEYQYKVSAGEWPAVWTTASGLTAPLSGLTATTDYTFRVRANYAEGNSDPVKIEFTTLDNCAIPTGFAATTIPGQGTKATFSWTKGFVDDDDWVLQYGTDNTFTTCTEITDGFTVEGNTVSFAATTGITAEQLHYARVRTDCGGDVYSGWTDAAEFTPSNYVDCTYGQTASYTTNYAPFYGYYANYGTLSQFIIPASNLVDMIGGSIRKMTFYSNTETKDWGSAVFAVYVKEVEASSFTSDNATALEDWATMTNVYTGSLSVSGNQMVVEFDNDYTYNGGNLMIGFNETTQGTSNSINWYYLLGPSNSVLRAYKTSSTGNYNYGRNNVLPKVTFNYFPTVYLRVTEIIEGTITGTSAQLSWAAPSENVTGYKYQYKKAGEEWPTAWTTTTATSVTLTTEPNTDYEFQVKAVYGSVESVATTKSFSTPCLEAYPVPYTYDFEEAKPFTCWTVATDGNVTRKNSTTTGYTHSGTYYMCFNGSQTNEIEMPSFAVATNTLRLEFWVRPESYSDSRCGSFAVGYYNSSNEFVALKTYTYNSTTSKYDGWESSTYKKERIDFDVAGVPADANFIFRQFGTTSNWYWFVDDVKVKLIPTCEDVDNVAASNITNHSATIAWDAIAGQSAWQIAYKAGANFNPNDATELATATVVDVTANPYLFDKTLEVGTTYYMYVRANCTASSDGYGDWSDSYATFTTKEATPAPSSFTASNLGSHQVDFKWTAGGGDYEESWDLYYVPSASAPEAPTAETPASKTVMTLPTNEAPYVLTGLTASSRYYIWVRSNHENNTHSGWVALTGDYFETLDACPTPTGLATSNLTSVSADLNWVGSSDVTSYTVQYRLLEEGTVYLNEGFEHSGVLPDGWDNSNSTSTSYKWEIGAGAGSSSTNNPVKTAANGDFNINYYCSTSSNYALLITPKMDLSGVGTAKLTFKYTNPIWSSGRYALTIRYRVAEGEWHDIITFTDNKEEWVNKEVVLEGMDDNYQIGFYVKGYNNDYGYGMGVDDVKVFEVGGTWLTASDNVETQAYTISGLTPANEYQTRVKSNCTSGEYCEPATFTTLADGNKVFTNATNDGKWGTAGNWAPSNAPALTDNVIVRANATIESGCVAQANKITFEGATTPTLTIADGGQLITNTAVTATVQKTINAAANWSTNSEGWYFIAHPITTYQNPSTLGLITDSNGETVSNADATYDLYKLDPTNNKWSNYRSSSFSLYNGNGYLYASKAGLTINFNGTINHNTSKEVSVYEGWNLVGNPFTYNAYINTPYYVMKADGTLNAEEQSSGTIAPCTAVAVEAAADGKVTFSKEAPSGAKGGINIALTEANTLEKVMDNAIVSFNNNKLGKFYFGSQDANIYIPQDGKDYAIVDAEAQGETPVNFKAAKNGIYTLLFNTEGVTMGYLHLIDNMTGNDVDLLANPSYSFDAKTTDYASRFKLVFATGNADDDSFAFISNGEIILNGVNGNTTVQVYDVTGRMVISTNGANRISIDNMAAGVYMLRLINGDTVKTQKIVVK